MRARELQLLGLSLSLVLVTKMLPPVLAYPGSIIIMSLFWDIWSPDFRAIFKTIFLLDLARTWIIVTQATRQAAAQNIIDSGLHFINDLYPVFTLVFDLYIFILWFRGCRDILERAGLLERIRRLAAPGVTSNLEPGDKDHTPGSSC